LPVSSRARVKSSASRDGAPLNKRSLQKFPLVSPSEGIRIQKELRHEVSMRWDGRNVRTIAGADVHFPSKDRVRAAVALLTFPDLELLETAIHEGPCTFPYIPGLLSFREIPSILEAWKRLIHQPDVILCDGQGIAHPRGLGLASHLGIVLDIPTIGCAKSPLFGGFDLPASKKGSHTSIRDRSGGTIGAVLRTRDATKPLYVSIGHRIDLRTAVRIVLSSTTRFRIPEPLRAAHRLAGSQ
jgi:deoxyribonuclease V